MKLSNRLGVLRNYFRQEEIIWDIGCDHGQLGLSFSNCSNIHEIHLVDPSLPVIETLKKTVKDSYITKNRSNIFIHQSEGQKVILSNKNNLIFIAGMGGKEIEEIVKALLPQMSVKDRLVISPHRKILELRNYLHHTSLHLEDELVLREDGQFYQILCLSLDSTNPKVSLYGDKIWKTTEGREYREQQMKFFVRHKDLASQEYYSFLNSLSH